MDEKQGLGLMDEYPVPMANDDESLDGVWLVTYTYYRHGELDLKATFTFVAPTALQAIQASEKALAVMFTDRAREVLHLYSVKRND